MLFLLLKNSCNSKPSNFHFHVIYSNILIVQYNMLHTYSYFIFDMRPTVNHASMPHGGYY